MTLIVHHLTHLGVLSLIEERVHFARRRFKHYEVIDFLAVLFGYAMSGERTLEAFYERLQPFASAFMALFGRDRLPHRSTLPWTLPLAFYLTVTSAQRGIGDSPGHWAESLYTLLLTCAFVSRRSFHQYIL